MPKKPEQKVIDACKKSLDPKDVLNAIVNDVPELAQALVDKGLAVEIKES